MTQNKIWVHMRFFDENSCHSEDNFFVQINQEGLVQLPLEGGLPENHPVLPEFGHGNLPQGSGVVFVCEIKF